MGKFKVGDRVRVKYVSAVGNLCSEKATVKLIGASGALVVALDRVQGEALTVHPGHCTRLVPRKRREWVLKGSGNQCLPFVDGPALKPGEMVTVVERRKK